LRQLFFWTNFPIREIPLIFYLFYFHFERQIPKLWDIFMTKPVI
jgi:hypothetical protein